jgi:hypothetical protein
LPQTSSFSVAASTSEDTYSPALVGELGRPGRAHLGDVGHLAARDRRRELVVGLRPRHELDLHVGAGVLGLEVLGVAVEDLLQLRRARIHDPGRHRAGDLPSGLGRRSLVVVGIAAAGHRERAHQGACGEPPLTPHLFLLVAHPRGWDD